MALQLRLHNANLLSERSTRISPEGSIDRSTITMTCETERLEIRIDTIPAGSTVTFDPIIGEIPNLVNGAYTNSAKLTADEIEEWTSNSKSVEIEGSGDGQGTQSPTPSPTETEVPSPSPSESESASESPSAAPMPTQTDDTDGPTQDPTESPAPDRDSDKPGPDSDKRLPRTGADSPPAAMGTGAVLLLAGGALLIASRRRKA